MYKVENSEIINLLLERDKNSIYKNSVIFDDNYSYDPNTEIGLLIWNLSQEGYTLTDKDVNLLKRYNIFVGEKEQKKNNFIVLSDFHSYQYPIDKIIEYYLDEYEYIYILGDATDRGPNLDGEGGLDVLFRIKSLAEQYPGRVIYIPGNHDSFIIGNDREDYRSVYTMMVNGGVQTIDDLLKLKQDNFNKYNDLINWLGNLPLQRLHQYNGQVYALAHAFFDQKLYDEDPNYSLNSLFNDSKKHLAGERVLWFRKKDVFGKGKSIADDKVNAMERKIIKECSPSSDVIVVIGHSKTKKGSREHDLINKHGDVVTVHCVDGGIAYNGSMLKYDGGSEVIVTKMHEHNDTSDREYCFDGKSILNNYIISSIYESGREAFNREFYFMPDSITNDEFADAVDSYEKKDEFTYFSGDYQDRLWVYKKIFVLNLVISGLFDKYGDYRKVSEILNAYIITGFSDYITRDGDLRYLLETLGVDDIKFVLEAYNCKDIDSYLRIKVLGNIDKKIKIKI